MAKISRLPCSSMPNTLGRPYSQCDGCLGFSRRGHPPTGLDRWPIAKGLHLFVQFTGDLGDLAMGDGLNPQRTGQFPDFSSGYALDIGFLDDLDQGCFRTGFCRDKKGHITAFAQFGNKEIHGAHPNVKRRTR